MYLPGITLERGIELIKQVYVIIGDQLTSGNNGVVGSVIVSRSLGTIARVELNDFKNPVQTVSCYHNGDSVVNALLRNLTFKRVALNIRENWQDSLESAGYSVHRLV